MSRDLPSISSSQEEKLPLWPIQAPGACGGGGGVRWRRNSGAAFSRREVDIAREKTMILGETRTCIIGERRDRRQGHGFGGKQQETRGSLKEAAGTALALDRETVSPVPSPMRPQSSTLECHTHDLK